MSTLRQQYLANKANWEQKMKPLFKDAAVQQLFAEQGYVKLSALDGGEVKDLLDFYTALSLKDPTGRGFHISMDTDKKDWVTAVNNKLYEVALPKLLSHFLNVKPIIACFVTKEPNPRGIVPVHQDWGFVGDEDQFQSFTCWVPLVDVKMHNGALGMIKGSHRFLDAVRPSPQPQAQLPIAKHKLDLFPYLQPVEMKAGEVLVFDNRTFHGSLPNVSNLPRVAFTIAFTHAEATMSHYSLKPGRLDTVLKYEIDETFFSTYENYRLSLMHDSGEMITGYKLVDELPYALPVYTMDEMVQLMAENGNTFNQLLYTELQKATEQTGVPIAHKVSDAQQPEKWIDKRPFLEKYSPINVLREIKRKLTA